MAEYGERREIGDEHVSFVERVTRGPETAFVAWLEGVLAREGWSGRYLAARIGMSAGGVSRWRRMEATPTRAVVPALARVTGVAEEFIEDLLRPAAIPARNWSMAHYLATQLPEDLSHVEVRLIVLQARAYRQWREEVREAQDRQAETRAPKRLSRS